MDFPSTHWSRVLAAGNTGALNRLPALEDLCRAYWMPLYSFLRRHGHAPHDAEDLVQGFLARLLAREDLAGVAPDKGRFRAFLLASLRNYVVKHALREKALKRGGGVSFIPIDAGDVEVLCGPDLHADSPEAAFDQRFAQAVLARAFAALREEFRARGKEDYFDTLAPFLDGTEHEGYRSAAAKLGVAPGTLAVSIHRLRARLREHLRAEVHQLCGSSIEADLELSHLLGAWSR